MIFNFLVDGSNSKLSLALVGSTLSFFIVAEGSYPSRLIVNKNYNVVNFKYCFSRKRSEIIDFKTTRRFLITSGK